MQCIHETSSHRGFKSGRTLLTMSPIPKSGGHVPRPPRVAPLHIKGVTAKYEIMQLQRRILGHEIRMRMLVF